MSLAPVTLGSDKSGEALSGRRMLSEREAVPLGSEPGDKTAASLCSPLPSRGLHCTSPGKPGRALVPRGPWRAGPRPGSSSHLGADAPISPDLLSPQCSLRSALSTSSRRPTRPTAPPYPSQPESIFLCSGQYPSVDPRGLADSLETSLLPTQPEPSALLPNPPPPHRCRSSLVPAPRCWGDSTDRNTEVSLPQPPFLCLSAPRTFHPSANGIIMPCAGVCAYVCVRVCVSDMCASVFACAHVSMHVCLSVRMDVHVCGWCLVCPSVYVCVYCMYICVICVSECVYVCVHIVLCECVCVSPMHVHMCMYVCPCACVSVCVSACAQVGEGSRLFPRCTALTPVVGGPIPPRPQNLL